MAICMICEEKELSPRSRLKTCANCRQSMGMWDRRTPAERLERRRKLHVYDLRMENVILHPGDLKAVPQVKPFRTATQIRKLARQEKHTNGRS